MKENISFGPPSEPINVAKFIENSIPTPLTEPISILPKAAETKENDPTEHRVEDECSLADLSSQIEDIWHDPYSLAYLHHRNSGDAAQHFLSVIRNRKQKEDNQEEDPSKDSKGLSSIRPHLADQTSKAAKFLEEFNARSTRLQVLVKQLSESSLECSTLQPGAGLFVRERQNKDVNVLVKPKEFALPSEQGTIGPSHAPCAILSASIYHRVSWSSALQRSSRHSLLSSHTLADLYGLMPCVSREIPREKYDNDEWAGYYLPPRSVRSSGCAVCIEGEIYGSRIATNNYAENIFQLISAMPGYQQPAVRKAVSSMEDTRLSSLTIKLHEPYWLLHEGNCEHFIVFDQIRLSHASDNLASFPLTTHIAPPILDLCQICTRLPAPATLSVVGDVRLGESPCPVCDACWERLGEPPASIIREGTFMVVPLPRYEMGWRIPSRTDVSVP